MADSSSEFLFRHVECNFWGNRKSIDFPFHVRSVIPAISSPVLISDFYPIEIPCEIVTTPPTASHLGGMLAIDYITRIISCI